MGIDTLFDDVELSEIEIVRDDGGAPKRRRAPQDSMMALANRVEQAAGQRNYSAAYQALRRMPKRMRGERMAGRCLAAALDCTPALFRAVLDHCEAGEYVAERQWQLTDTDIGFARPRFVHLNGTILTLAAALDRTEHMKLLLERGWDVNAASPASEQAFLDAGRDAYIDVAFGMTRGFGGLMMSVLTMGESEYRFAGGAAVIGGRRWQTDCCTPLAAAIACGSRNAAALLLRAEALAEQITLRFAAPGGGFYRTA